MRKGFHPQNSTNLRCNFCKVKNGGVLGIKQRLAGGYRNANACHQWLPEVKKNEAKYQVNSMPDFDDVTNNEDYDIDDLDDIVEFNPPFKKPCSTRGSTSTAIQSKPKKPRNIGPLNCYYITKPETRIAEKEEDLVITL
ncbi:hypothetical protein RHMOL_Rhmol06G0076800 [Rhododendron molle]|uniref:Uncharacterized protein n=1 Tax=Rhododendron molle TaxID=49168 RepID=A0ACC0NB16_RHOML|nr:hypothetical protein RHMOL_Rhmol06G0076800 [Rhododendron molle]